MRSTSCTPWLFSCLESLQRERANMEVAPMTNVSRDADVIGRFVLLPSSSRPAHHSSFRDSGKPNQHISPCLPSAFFLSAWPLSNARFRCCGTVHPAFGSIPVSIIVHQRMFLPLMFREVYHDIHLAGGFGAGTMKSFDEIDPHLRAVNAAEFIPSK